MADQEIKPGLNLEKLNLKHGYSLQVRQEGDEEDPWGIYQDGRIPLPFIGSPFLMPRNKIEDESFDPRGLQIISDSQTILAAYRFPAHVGHKILRDVEAEALSGIYQAHQERISPDNLDKLNSSYGGGGFRIAMRAYPGYSLSPGLSIESVSFIKKSGWRWLGIRF